MLSNILKWIPLIAAYVSGRRSAINDQKDNVIDIKTKQIRDAANTLDRDGVIDSLRDDKGDRW